MMDDATLMKLIRLAVDGELTPEQSNLLEQRFARHPEDRALLAFEHRLREAVARCMMEQATVPVDLPDRVRSAIRIEAIEETEETPAVIGRIGVASPSTAASAARERRWLPRWAMAAGIVLLAGTSVLIGLLGEGTFRGRSNEFVGDPGGGRLGNAALPAGSALSPNQERVALALDSTHWADARMLTQAAHAREFIRQNLELSFDVPDFASFGYRFDGLAVKRVRDPQLGTTDHAIDLRYVPISALPGHASVESLHMFTFANAVEPGTLERFVDAPRPRSFGRPYLIEFRSLPGQPVDAPQRSFFAWLDPATGLEQWVGPVDVPGAHAIAVHAGMPSGPVTRLAAE